jgi:hypothetical protein
MKIPLPKISYKWLYDILTQFSENDDTIYEIFYNKLKGSLLEHSAYSNELLYLMDLYKKKIAI